MYSEEITAKDIQTGEHLAWLWEKNFDMNKDHMLLFLGELNAEGIKKFADLLGLPTNKGKPDLMVDICEKLSTGQYTWDASNPVNERAFNLTPAPGNGKKVIKRKKAEKEKPYILVEAIRDLVPRPSEEDYATLIKSIERDGLQEPITVLGTSRTVEINGKKVKLPKGTLIDGYSRVEACEELGVEIAPDQIRTKSPSNQEVLGFVFRCSMRRNLTSLQRALLVKTYFGKDMEAIQREVARNRGKNVSKARKEGETVEDRGEDPNQRTARAIKAQAANISQDMQAKLDFIDRYAPIGWLEQKQKEGAEQIGPVYAEVKRWWDYVKNFPEELEKVKEEEQGLKETYDRLFEERGFLKKETKESRAIKTLRRAIEKHLCKAKGLKKREYLQENYEGNEEAIFKIIQNQIDKYEIRGRNKEGK